MSPKRRCRFWPVVAAYATGGVSLTFELHVLSICVPFMQYQSSMIVTFTAIRNEELPDRESLKPFEGE